MLFERGFLRPRQRSGPRLQRLHEMMTAFGDDLDRIGRQQLVVAERGGDSARRLVVFEPGLHVVTAVAAGLEAVDADDLFFVQAGREGNLPVGALEFTFALRPARNEFEFLSGGGKKIGDHRHVGPGGRRLLLRRLRRIDRFGRAGINRRLGEHIIVERQRFLARALGDALAPFLRNEAPIRLGLGGVSGLRLLIFSKRAAILRDCRGRRRRSHRGLPHLGRLRGRRHHGQQDRERTGAGVMVSNANQ